MSKIFLYYFSKGHQCVPDISPTQHKHSNKQQYAKYKHDLSHLLIGVHSDAVVVWLLLASFFNVNGKYLISLNIINYALSQITDEKYVNYFRPTFRMMHSIIMTPKQESAIHKMRNEKLITILKSLTISRLRFEFESQIIPKELQHEVITSAVDFPPLTYAHFLRFLCLFHLHEYTFCRDAMQQLLRAIDKIYSKAEILNLGFLRSVVLAGISRQMIGETHRAKKAFEFVAQYDDLHVTTDNKRLRELSFNF